MRTFTPKADYKRVSIVLVAHSEEQKSDSRLSTIPTIAAVLASIKMQFPPRATSGPAHWLACGLELWYDN